MVKWYEPSPGESLKPTREFIPNDVEFRTAEQINERIEELIEKKSTFNPETQFVGMQRLGKHYTVAEPFAFFEDPTHLEQRASRMMYGTIGVVSLTAASVITHNMFSSTTKRALIRSAVAAPFIYFGMGWFMDKILQHKINNRNVFFHYALMKEDVFPKIERKKFGEIITDWTAHRSLNNLSKEYGA